MILFSQNELYACERHKGELRCQVIYANPHQVGHAVSVICKHENINRGSKEYAAICGTQ